MRAYVNQHPTEVTPRFREGGRGRAVANAALSVPLRTEDLVAILYHSQLDGRGLVDADQVRTTIAEALVNKGGHRIAAEKAALHKAIAAGGDYDQARLERIRARVDGLFPPRQQRAGLKEAA